MQNENGEDEHRSSGNCGNLTGQPNDEIAFRYLQKSKFNFKALEAKTRGYEQETLSIDSEKLNQLTELVKEMPSDVSGRDGKKFSWPRLCKKTQADHQMQAKNAGGTELDRVPCSVPHLKSTGEEDSYAPNICCPESVDLDVGGINCTDDDRCNGRFDADLDGYMRRGMNSDHIGRSSRKSRSKSSDSYDSDNFDAGINRDYNRGRSGAFSNRMKPSFDGRMNGGFNGGTNGFFSFNSLAAINGLCVSLNALNGALGGLSGKINNLNTAATVGIKENMSAIRTMVPFGDGINKVVSMQGGGSVMQLSGGENFSGDVRRYYRINSSSPQYIKCLSNRITSNHNYYLRSSAQSKLVAVAIIGSLDVIKTGQNASSRDVVLNLESVSAFFIDVAELHTFPRSRSACCSTAARIDSASEDEVYNIQSEVPREPSGCRSDRNLSMSFFDYIFA
ncbi:hypothetical protein Aperf_G00000013102 [Anoplocephala perfoliata]